MLRGSFTARIDEKSRLKIPRDFLKSIEEKYGRELFVTSLDGNCAHIYPMPVWTEIERQLGAQGLQDGEGVLQLGRPLPLVLQGRPQRLQLRGQPGKGCGWPTATAQYKQPEKSDLDGARQDMPVNFPAFKKQIFTE